MIPIITPPRQDEYIAPSGQVRVGFSGFSSFRASLRDSRAVKYLLKEDEYIDEEGRLRILLGGASFLSAEPGSRFELAKNEYIDEFGIVRVGMKERRELEEFLPHNPWQQDMEVPLGPRDDTDQELLRHSSLYKCRSLFNTGLYMH